MKSKSFVVLGSLLLLSACNLYGGVDKPSGDAQLLSAARSCLDRGDYDCATKDYQALSSAYNDVKLSEETFTTLAQQNVFSISDLITTLGSSQGNGQSLALLAQTMAARGKTDGATRTLLQTSYASNGNIVEPNLRYFMQFLTAYAMLNEVLANAVGADGVLSASDLVTSVSGCISLGASCAVGTNACSAPAGTALLDSVAGEESSMSIASGWSTSPTLQKVFDSASSAGSAISHITTSYSGIFSVIQQFNTYSGALPAACKRQALITILFGS